MSESELTRETLVENLNLIECSWGDISFACTAKKHPAFKDRKTWTYQTDKMKIGKKKAYAIRFEYRVKDAALVQVCDLVAFKYKKHFYSVYYVTRKVNASANLPAFQEVLNSITLK